MQTFSGIFSWLITNVSILFLKHASCILFSFSICGAIKLVCRKWMLNLLRLILLSSWIQILIFNWRLLCVGSWIVSSWWTTIGFKEIHGWVSRVRLASILNISYIGLACGKLEIGFRLTWILFGLSEWKSLHFFIKFVHLLFDRFNFFLSSFFIWLLESFFWELPHFIFIVH